MFFHGIFPTRSTMHMLQCRSFFQNIYEAYLCTIESQTEADDWIIVSDKHVSQQYQHLNP